MENKLEKVFNSFINNKQIYIAQCYVQNSEGSFSWEKACGDRNIDSPFVIASITKMFTTSCIFILEGNNKLSLDDKIEKYLGQDIMEGLLVHKGIDYSSWLTIRHLLLQSSGFSDEFEAALSKDKRLKLLEHATYSFEEVVSKSKLLKPRFAPCYDKAFYANINFDMLGKIIENITGCTLEEVYKKYIFEPLGLNHTYLFNKNSTYIPLVYFNEKRLNLSKTLACAYASGGVVSNARELMIFLKAFFQGKLFDKSRLDNATNYRKLQANMGPVYYGTGYMQIPLKGVLTAFQNKGELIGHLGSTGSFAFYYPRKDLFLVGDVCQLANPALPIRLLLKLVYQI